MLTNSCFPVDMMTVLLVRSILLLLYRFISVPLSVSSVSLFLCFVIWACPEINALID